MLSLVCFSVRGGDKEDMHNQCIHNSATGGQNQLQIKIYANGTPE